MSARAAAGTKRKAETVLKNGSKAAKLDHQLFPLFSNAASTSMGTKFLWLNIDETCLHGVHNNPPSLSKVALFDLDGTLIRPKEGRKYPRDGSDWEWWHNKVERRLNQAVQEGFSIVIVTNQGGFSSSKGASRMTEWKKKIRQIAAQLPSVPFRIFAASDYDQYRKPLPGIWHALQKVHSEDGVTLDKTESYFVGDAAGRVADHNCTDRLFALNAGIKFLTPEEYFLDQAPQKYSLRGFRPSSLPDPGPLFTPSNTPLVSSDLDSPVEIILFVGYPSTGKTTLYKKYFAPRNYVHVNQDVLGNAKKCHDLVELSLDQNKSCVVDNTNRNVATRAKYVDIAKKLNIPIRCFYFSAPYELAVHNNIYRSYFEPLPPGEKRRALLPPSAFTTFKAGFQPPTLEEGFTELKTVNFVFEGTEEERILWDIWTDG